MRIFHPTDLLASGGSAFLHALRMAVDLRASITVMHVDSDSDEPDLGALPGVRETLARWGAISDARDKEGVRDLGLSVRKVVRPGSDPVDACLQYLRKHPADLVVLATHTDVAGTAPKGRGWLRRRVAEPIARGSGEPTLFVPHGSTGFVDHATGAVAVRSVLVPITNDPAPHKAIALAARLMTAMGCTSGVFHLLHVGDARTDPGVPKDAPPGWRYEHQRITGDVVGAIVEAAERVQCDLLVMATKGQDGFLDALRGTHTERVLRAARCPVLAVPV